jgi:superfamily II RNA helicase
MVLYIENEKYPDEANDIYNEHFNQFPYPLSDFQKYAIQHIVDGNHVFCNVPTGSGKTLPALFAIAHFVEKANRKVIYCSPIKSLSNQKYHEFKSRFPNCSVGLITGDIKINQNADIIICTTEILMNFLLHGTVTGTNTPLELSITDVAMVILDECHYVFDVERGYVWETVIIKLPPNIQLLLLSGSFREPKKFCEWIYKIKAPIPQSAKGVMCIVDTHRIVPLTHYTYVTVNEGFFKKIKDKALTVELREATNKLQVLQDAKGVFNDMTYNKMTRTLSEFNDRQQYTNRKFVLNNLAQYLKTNEMLPAIYFVFSRKLCEQFAQDITTNLLEDDSKIPYIVETEYGQFMRKKLPNYAEYMTLPEYVQLIKLLEKGIAFHHSGMLPILRELVEFAISENRVKMLFATESFGIGLNCAIKTTVFTQLKKHDGNAQRFLYSHEYLQMAGRAGRRGIDTRGYVVHLNNIYHEQPTLLEYKRILKCEAPVMKSQYYISYNTVLAMSDTSDDTSEKSIMQYEINQGIIEQQRVIDKLRIDLEKKEQCVAMCKTPVLVIAQYMDLYEPLVRLNGKRQKDNERKMLALREQYYSITGDIALIQSLNEMRANYKKEEDYMTYLENYMANQTLAIRTILKTCGYDDVTKWQIAGNIHEIHPLVITDYIVKHREELVGMEVSDIVALLSLWCDIKMGNNEPYKELLSITVPPFVKEVGDLYEKYFALEVKHDVEYKTNVETSITAEYLGAMFESWVCNCDDLETAKFFIHEQLGRRGISLGDFTKGCLKMVAISKELVNALGDKNDYLVLAQQLALVEHALCKFVVTAQSLYV